MKKFKKLLQKGNTKKIKNFVQKKLNKIEKMEEVIQDLVDDIIETENLYESAMDEIQTLEKELARIDAKYIIPAVDDDAPWTPEPGDEKPKDACCNSDNDCCKSDNTSPDSTNE